MRFKTAPVAALAAATLALAAPASADYATSFEDAKKMAAESGLPILLDIGTEW